MAKLKAGTSQASGVDGLRLRLPSGSGLLMLGSGIYWILSSQLIASFTVLTPQVFLSDSSAVTLVLVIGVLASAAGLWIINDDINQLLKLLNRIDGWLYLTPLLLSACDVVVTLIGLSSSTGVVELNPLVAAAVQAGPAVFAAFAISYMALSAGLILLMLQSGRLLFPSRPWRFLSLSMICGAASFGLLNNMLILAAPNLSGYSLIGAVMGAFLIAELIFGRLVKGEGREIWSSRLSVPA